MKTCKSLLKKARADKREPLLAILEWRNTPSEGLNASPAQLLYGRRARTQLPVAKKLLVPHVITGVPEKIKVKKQKQKFYYDRHTRELPKLCDGDAIRMRLPGKNEWSLGRVISDVGNRSYVVEVNGQQYRRNRRCLRTSPEKLEPVETSLELSEPTERTESSPANESPPPTTPSASVVASEPFIESRPVRDRRPPV